MGSADAMRGAPERPCAAAMLDGWRAEAQRLREVERLLWSMSSAPYSSPSLAPRGSGPSDPSDRWDAEIDRRAALEDERSSILRDLSRCRELIAGVAAWCPGRPYARALEEHYLGLRTWASISAEHRVSLRTVLLWRDVACDYVDSMGLARAIRGDGSAQD